MRAYNWLSHLLGLLLLIILPVVFAHIIAAGLEKLHISHTMAGVLVVAIFLGGLINLPTARIAQTRAVTTTPLAI